jgi:ribosomal protein S18 acetylase RimI-like enzyme
MADPLSISLASPSLAPSLVEPILRSVPDWFGIEEATLAYIADSARKPTCIASNNAQSVGFLTVTHHNPHSAEVHCIAVHRDHHGSGVGTTLLRHVESLLRRDGVRFLQVKTLGPSKPSLQYARTLHFYLSRGFTPLEEVQGLWPGIPCLILVKAL